MIDTLQTAVAAHYGRAGLTEAILAGAKAAGADPDNLRPIDLSPVDEFHTAGRAATLKALAMLAPKPGMHVLDAGCGIGGTARTLAAEHGCRVTGIDLTPEYIETARELTAMTGLSDSCVFEVGSVTGMPLPDTSFDAAVTLHVAMNIADRPAFYGEVTRTLKPGGRFCLFDVMKGPGTGMLYPVPWAETDKTSFLKSAEETRALLATAGFEVTEEENLRDFAIAFFKEVFAKIKAAGGPPPLGLHLLTGANSPEKFANYAKALDAHQIEPVIMVARRL